MSSYTSASYPKRIKDAAARLNALSLLSAGAKDADIKATRAQLIYLQATPPEPYTESRTMLELGDTSANQDVVLSGYNVFICTGEEVAARCANCENILDKPLYCTGCFSCLFGNKDGQKSNWPKHKKNCCLEIQRFRKGLVDGQLNLSHNFEGALASFENQLCAF